MRKCKNHRKVKFKLTNDWQNVCILLTKIIIASVSCWLSHKAANLGRQEEICWETQNFLMFFPWPNPGKYLLSREKIEYKKFPAVSRSLCISENININVPKWPSWSGTLWNVNLPQTSHLRVTIWIMLQGIYRSRSNDWQIQFFLRKATLENPEVCSFITPNFHL